MAVQVEQLITEHLDLWTQAQTAKSTSGRGSNNKIELTGIKKLRELILELAVRGKLVPQDPNNEPASELLKRIAAEKEALIKAGKLKKQKPLRAISDEEMPFELPVGWELVRFGDIAVIERGGSPRPIQDFITEDSDGLNWIKIGDTDQGGKYIKSCREKIRKEGLIKTRMVYPGDFLLTNSMSFGRPYITLIEGCIHDGWLRISPPNSINKDYLYLLLSSPFIKRAFQLSAAGAVVLNLNADKVREVLLPLPSEAEQKRIEAKVDELMALCDLLEQQSYQKLDAHNQLVDALLATLTQSQNADELASNWQRLAAHFDTLFTTEYSINVLKQIILQLAVMGKLVKQDPNDEPASELLKRIAAEKDALVKAGKIKTQKPLPPISDDEKPFELPKGWQWCRLDDICYGITSGSTPPQSHFNNDGGIPYLKVYNIKNQKIDFEYKPQFIDFECHKQKLKRSVLYPGDVVMNIVGPPLGKIAIIPDTYAEWNCNQAIVFFRPIIDGLNHFIYTYLITGMFLDSIELIGTAGQDNISVTKSRSILFPLPAISEQDRIVLKVDELMNICDALSTKLDSKRQIQAVLAKALVEQVVG
jgi:type I restriction enzyme S subunit